MSKYTSDYEPPGKVKAEGNTRKVWWNGHLYLKTKKKVWRELC